ncbi:hypothetical protein CXB51_014446 [Gossypium anomalum]|uniref:Uncharacterized protein n=1 Tax=Gossypium anomalum TaxID=47600 RepID=A0A8J5ZLE9_9ROSI|nr:hypothetical protein CXB51_014446 [Gossypium anomalum]
MDLQQLQNDTPLERYNAEKNRYQENCYIGESSTSQQQPEPEMKEEHHFPEERSCSRSVLERMETLMDRICRQKMTFFLACAPAQDRGSCMSFESKFVHFMNQLYNNGNNKVKYKDFQGLEDALANTAWGKVPDYLKSIGIRIEDARGKATEFSHTGIQILVCAVIKEMEYMSLEDLDWGTLKKWAAALNYGNEHGFQVGFANNLLQWNSLQLPIQMKPIKQKKNENEKPIPRAPFLVASVATKTLPLNRLQQITFQSRASSYITSSSNHVLISRSGLVMNASSAIVAISDIPCPIGVVSDAESDPPENEPDDIQMHLSMSTGSKKRSREIDNSVEAKGKAPKKWISGKKLQPPSNSQNRKVKRTVGKQNRLKIFHHQVDRRRKTVFVGQAWVSISQSKINLV